MFNIKPKVFVLHAPLGLFIGHVRLIPGVTVVAGIDNQDIALFHGGLLGDHLRGIDTVIGYQVRNIHHHTWPAKVL